MLGHKSLNKTNDCPYPHDILFLIKYKILFILKILVTTSFDRHDIMLMVWQQSSLAEKKIRKNIEWIKLEKLYLPLCDHLFYLLGESRSSMPLHA